MECYKDKTSFVASVPRVRVPTLMIKGRFDSFAAVETGQKPMFNLLPLAEPADKQHLIFQYGHDGPQYPYGSPMNEWFDRHLGAVE